MTEPRRPLKVFLCHSSGDKPAVRELYHKLAAEGWIDPWLDARKLLPGQDWRTSIEEAVELADNVVICLSNASVDKEGFIQKELRYAKEISLEKPEGTIFLIPLRLDDCEVPRGLRFLQWVDYFGEHKEPNYQILLESLKIRFEEITRKEAELKAKKDQEEKKRQEELERKRAEDKMRLNAEELERKELEERIRKEAREKVRLEMEESLRKEAEEQARREFIVKSSSLVAQRQQISEPEKPVEKPKAEPTHVLQEKKEQPKPAPARLPAAAPQDRQSLLQKVSSSIPVSRQTWGGIEFVRIPAGKFLMGSKRNKLAFDDEYPQHTVNLPYDYWMARFPVTNAQYAEYSKAKGGKHPVSDWQEKQNHPVTYVSWQEAMNYCRWLAGLLKGKLPQGLTLRLPTEAEWEKAARGPDGLEWPWGDEFDKNKCNSSEGGKGGTTSVGLYSPQGDSPYGCADMSGNVWEWCHSLFKPYPYQAEDGREKETGFGSRVLRGGSFLYARRNARCAYRDRYSPGDFYGNSGFRVCVSPIPSL